MKNYQPPFHDNQVFLSLIKLDREFWKKALSDSLFNIAADGRPYIERVNVVRCFMCRTFPTLYLNYLLSVLEPATQCRLIALCAAPQYVWREYEVLCLNGFNSVIEPKLR